MLYDNFMKNVRDFLYRITGKFNEENKFLNWFYENIFYHIHIYLENRYIYFIFNTKTENNVIFSLNEKTLKQVGYSKDGDKFSLHELIHLLERQIVRNDFTEEDVNVHVLILFDLYKIDYLHYL